MPTASAAASSSTTSSQFTYSGKSYFPTPFHLQQPQAFAGTAAPILSVQLPPLPPVVSFVYPLTATLPVVYTLPQYQEVQQLFQRDAQTITPEALGSVKAALASSEFEHKVETKESHTSQSCRPDLGGSNSCRLAWE